MHYPGNVGMKERKTRSRNISSTHPIRRDIREDMWAYEIIASSSMGPAAVTNCPQNYYLDAKRLLHICFPNVFQNWERLMNGRSNWFFPPPPLFKRKQSDNEYINGQCISTNDGDSKNILLLAQVATSLTNEQEQCNPGSFSVNENSSTNLNQTNSNPFLSNGNEFDDSKEYLKMFNNTMIKSEDESCIYMNI